MPYNVHSNLAINQRIYETDKTIKIISMSHQYLVWGTGLFLFSLQILQGTAEVLCFSSNLLQIHLQQVLHSVPVTPPGTVPEPPAGFSSECPPAPFNIQKSLYQALPLWPFCHGPPTVSSHKQAQTYDCLVNIFFFTL